MVYTNTFDGTLNNFKTFNMATNQMTYYLSYYYYKF